MELMLSKYKNIILNILVVLVAVFFASKIYKAQDNEIVGLREVGGLEVNKNNVLSDIALLEKKISAFRQFLNQKDVTAVLNNINKMATLCDITINSVRPQPEAVFNTYTKIPYRLSIEIKDYHQLGRFISALESSQFVYVVDEISIASEGEEDKGTRVDMLISTFFFKK